MVVVSPSFPEQSELQTLITSLTHICEEAKVSYSPLVPWGMKQIDELFLAECLRVFYQATALFPSPEIKQRLLSVDFAARYHIWYIDLKDILHQLDAITEDGQVKMNKAQILQVIKNHLDIKINMEIFYWQRMLEPLNGKAFTPKIKRHFYNLLRRRDCMSSKESGLFVREGFCDLS
jgi:hypothetical protein